MRGQKIGEQLIYAGLDTLNEFGYGAVVVVGDPAYYHRFGFEPAARHGLRCRWPGAEAAFQVYRLADDAFVGAEGEIDFAEPFSRLA